MLDALIDARDLLVSTLKAGTGINDVYDATPLVPETDSEYIVVLCPTIARSFTGARVVEETYTFDVEIRKAWTEDADLTALKVGVAQDCESLLSADWNTENCYLPQIVSVEFPDDSLTRRFFSTRLTFQVLSDVSQ